MHKVIELCVGRMKGLMCVLQWFGNIERMENKTGKRSICEGLQRKLYSGPNMKKVD